MSEPDLSSISDEIIQVDGQSDLEDRFLFNARKREETLKVVLHWITMIALVIVFIVLVIVFLIRIGHFILPTDYKWLSDEQLQTIDKFLFSGALGGIVSKHAGKLFGTNSSR